MSVRIGVDVGGTFTKAVAFELNEGVVARSTIPTTHSHPDGPAAGVVQAIADVVAQVGSAQVDLVTYSTTQAVNALLEGDVADVGVIGLGSAPDLRKARRRTRLEHVELSAERRLRTIPEFLDVTHGLSEAEVAHALDRLRAAGATAISVAESFATESAPNEQRVLELAADRAVPGCAASDMSGLYGLELRAVTAAINASILPIAVRTADFVQNGVIAGGITAPVMVMRGDGGATDLEGFRRTPARTLYSGPAASVAGVLRFGRIVDGVVVEVGGTSTNVAAIRRGRPSLSYVQVASHATAVRALDVRVVGVAGGSMLRARRGRLYGVGPRSAHIAGLPYSCYLEPEMFEGAVAEMIAPRAGDPVEYVTVHLADGRHAAVTNTCAAVALGVVQDGDYADGNASAAVAALDAAGRLLRLDGAEVARRMLEASAGAVGELVRQVVADHDLEEPTIVAVGGGAGGLGRYTAAALGFECRVPPHAEAISSIGDALSLVRAERERHVSTPTAADSALLAAMAEEECVAAGAASESVDVQVEFDAERSTLRAVALGAVGLASGVLPGRPAIDGDAASAVAADHGFGPPAQVGRYWIATRPPSDVIVFDRYGDVIVEGEGGVVLTHEREHAVDELIERCTRRVGPVTIAPDVRLADGSRLLEVSPTDAGRALLERREDAALIITRA